jgi:two-component system sensor histidine kinase MprB
MYVVTQQVVLGQLDQSLAQRAASTRVRETPTVKPSTTQPGTFDIGPTEVIVSPPQLGDPSGYYQLVTAAGKVVNETGQTSPVTGSQKGGGANGASGVYLPVSGADLDVAAGNRAAYYRDDSVSGVPVRIYTSQVADGVALQTARSTSEINSIFAALRIILGLVAAGGVVLAAILGWFIARSGLRPINRLRAAVDHVTETGDMSQRVREGDDELGRLGAHFNRMLGALEESLRTQRQLVADASHELRTPLASLRTNIEVLQRSPSLVGAERDRLLRDVIAQVEQLTRLIGDLIDLARGDQSPEEREEVRLDWIVAAAAERAAINWPKVRFDSELRESTVVGQAGRLERAVSNLLDNAGKWSEPGQVVEVRVTDHEVTVRDHGPGIDAADLTHVFDRFWRAPGARSLPGSGLGLAIVRQVAETHGATVTAELPAGGGTLMRLKFADADASRL